METPMPIWKSAIFCAAALSVAGLLVVTVPARAIEQPKFRLVHAYAGFEVRDYASCLVAETTVKGTFEDAGDDGFKRLFDYISGNNSTRSSIAMTAPVIQSGRKIAMTAPVLQSVSSGSFAISFVMPSSWTLQSLPVPNDRRVVIREMPSMRVAAIRYSGFWSEDNYRTHLEALKAAMAREHLNAMGEPVWARYDPPFMPWFFRRNEILIPVSR
jgi:hypothetical protein